jgi:predicted hotdog family 3-hydroxylacyl-ACP dehydratase
MRMVDTFDGMGENSCRTALEVRQNNVFCIGGKLIEPGLIEHVAQSAAAFSGFEAYSKGEPPKVGYLAEIKSFSFFRLPLVGEVIRTDMTLTGKILGMSLVHGVVTSGDGKIAEGDLKVYIPEE